jgi:hypothetical protein
VQVTEDLRRVGYVLGSQAIKALVFARAQQGRWRDLVDLLHAAASEKEVGKMSGDALESFGHAVCLQGIELSSDDIRQVFRKAPGRPPAQKAVKEPTPEQRQVIMEIQNAFRGIKILVWDNPSKMSILAMLTESYVMPITRIQESWDSLICSGDDWVNAIQFTRNVNHGTGAGGILKLLQRISGSQKKVRVVHAVPEERFEEYCWMSWTGEKAAERVGKTGLKEIVVKQGVLTEDKVPVELESIEQWVIRLKLPEPGSDAASFPRAALSTSDNLSEY